MRTPPPGARLLGDQVLAFLTRSSSGGGGVPAGWRRRRRATATSRACGGAARRGDGSSRGRAPAAALPTAAHPAAGSRHGPRQGLCAGRVWRAHVHARPHSQLCHHRARGPRYVLSERLGGVPSSMHDGAHCWHNATAPPPPPPRLQASPRWQTGCWRGLARSPLAGDSSTWTSCRLSGSAASPSRWVGERRGGGQVCSTDGTMCRQARPRTAPRRPRRCRWCTATRGKTIC